MNVKNGSNCLIRSIKLCKVSIQVSATYLHSFAQSHSSFWISFGDRTTSFFARGAAGFFPGCLIFFPWYLFHFLLLIILVIIIIVLILIMTGF
jgi:hypothetical protein